MRLQGTAAASVALVAVAAFGVGIGALGAGPFALVAVGALAAIGGHVAWASADPALQAFGPARCAARTGRAEVALTFDDGPDPVSTPALLDALAAAGARATFFLLVDQAERYPELTRALAREHEIGLHGLSHHPWLTLWDPGRGAAELSLARDRLAALIGRPVVRFRPPFGAVSPRLTEAVRRAGLELVWCSVRTRDGGRLTAEQVRQRCARARAGDIVLLHEGRRPTVDAIPGVLDDLRARGLRAVDVETLCGSA